MIGVRVAGRRVAPGLHDPGTPLAFSNFPAVAAWHAFLEVPCTNLNDIHQSSESNDRSVLGLG